MSAGTRRQTLQYSLEPLGLLPCSACWIQCATLQDPDVSLWGGPCQAGQNHTCSRLARLQCQTRPKAHGACGA